MSYSGQKITPKAVKSLTELEPGDHIRVPSSKEPSQCSSGFTSSSEIESVSTPLSNIVESSHPESRKGKTYTHHLLVVKPITDRKVKVIHKVKNENENEISILEETMSIDPRDVTVLEYDTSHTGQEAVERARQKKKEGEEYCLLTKNCEHFVTEVRTGKKESAQIEGAVDGAVSGGVLGSVVGTGGGAGLGAVIGGAIGSVIAPGGRKVGAQVGGFIGAFAGAAIGVSSGGIAGCVEGLKAVNKIE